MKYNSSLVFSVCVMLFKDYLALTSAIAGLQFAIRSMDIHLISTQQDDDDDVVVTIYNLTWNCTSDE
jgi:hypothetical protein